MTVVCSQRLGLPLEMKVRVRRQKKGIRLKEESVGTLGLEDDTTVTTNNSLLLFRSGEIYKKIHLTFIWHNI